MDLETLRERIEALDPVLHRALRRALQAEYERRAGQARVDPFEAAFREAASDIAERYLVGSDDYIRAHHPDLYQRTEEADRRMNEAWAAGRRGKGTIEEFRRAVEAWRSLHLQGIALHAGHNAGGASRAERGAEEGFECGDG